MAKQRFRDIKQGRVSSHNSNKKHPEKQIHANKRVRFKSIITDGFMLLMPIVYIVFYVVFGSRENFAEHMLAGWAYILFPLVVVQIIFMTRSKQGQTPGMKAYNLALLDLKTAAKPESGIIIYRQMLSVLSFMFFGWITMFFRKDNRMLHEILSSTALSQIPQKEKA